MTLTGAAPLAATPIAVILVLMIGLRRPAWVAGLAGVAVTLAIAVFAFGYGTVILGGLGVAGAVAGAFAEAAFTAATILWIIVPALGIHQLQLATGATDVLRLAMGRLSRDPGIVALLVAWFFALFMEGAAGFGASVALAAPFLVSAGFRRVDAVTIVLFGHAVGVSFGAVGTPIIPQVAATGLSAVELSQPTATYHALLGWLPLGAAMVLAARAPLPVGDEAARLGRRALFAWTLLAAVLFLVPYVAIAWLVGPELPTLGGALLGGLAFVGVLRRRLARASATSADPSAAGGTAGGSGAAGGDGEGNGPTAATPAPALSRPARSPSDPAAARQVARAAAPYLVLVALVMATRLVPPLREALQGVTWSWALDGGFTGSVQPLYHPGTMLLAGLLGGALLQRATVSRVRQALRRTLAQLGTVTVALVAMLALSRLMVHGGLTTALAEAAGAAAGGAWPLFAPLVGMLGTFVTGSATASNILFTDFQVATADGLGLSVAPLAGAQGFGAAVGNLVCPHNIVAAGATVSLEGREGDVLRRTLGVGLAWALLGGVLALAFTA